jgi:hypothetical protein
MADSCRSCLSKIPSDARDCPSCGQPQLHPCPFCNELIRIEAVKCKHCKTFLDSKSASSSSGVVCPMCRQGTEYVPSDQISVAGWVVFAVLIAVGCLPLCWIGLLIKETKYRCARCGAFRP